MADTQAPLSELGLISTEQINPRTRDIDQLSTLAILEKINAEDALVHQAVAQALPQIAQVVDAIVYGFEQGGRLLYFGAGTSGRLGVLDASECPPTYGADPEQVQGMIAGGDIALRHAVEGAEDDVALGESDVEALEVGQHDVVVGISASGHAPYVHGVIDAAKARGAFTACIVCHPGSKLIARVKQAIVVDVGPEVVAGSTRMKAGTAQKLVLNMLSSTAMIQTGKTYENLMVDVQPTNEKLKARATRMVSTLAKVSETQAQETLQTTQFQVKPAIVMLVKQCDLKTAQAILDQHHGKLRPALN